MIGKVQGEKMVHGVRWDIAYLTYFNMKKIYLENLFSLTQFRPYKLCILRSSLCHFILLVVSWATYMCPLSKLYMSEETGGLPLSVGILKGCQDLSTTTLDPYFQDIIKCLSSATVQWLEAGFEEMILLSTKKQHQLVECRGFPSLCDF